MSTLRRKKSARASARKRSHKARGHKAHKTRRTSSARRHVARRTTHRRKKGYVFTAARRAALRKAQLANRHHSRIGRKGARIRKFKTELRDLGYGEYAVNPRRTKHRRARVTPGSAAARLAKWRWHHNPAAAPAAYIPGDFLPGLRSNPKHRRARVTPGSAAARLAKWRWHHNPAAAPAAYIPGDFLPGLRSNPFRKGKLRKTTRRIGKVFKRKGRYYIVSRLRNGVKVARPWSKRTARR